MGAGLVAGMDLSRFRYLLDAHGAELGRWPEAERAAAEALLAQSSEAIAAHRAAVDLDRRMRQAMPAVSDRMVALVLAKIDVMVPETKSFSDDLPAEILPAMLHRRWVPAALLASMIVLGFILGGVMGPPPPREPTNLVDLLSNHSTSGFAL